MHKYRLPALSLLLLVLAACAAIFLFPYAQASRALAWGGGTTDHADAATASASVVSTRIGMTSTATATHGRRHHHHAATPQQAPTKGTSQSVWETQYAALDNDPITLAADPRWLPIGTRVYAPRWHKYYIMEDECVECEADWAANHFHHVDLYMSSSVQAGVVSCENAATKDQAENDVVILNPAANLPVDTPPLYTNAGGCVYASHQYS